MYTLSYHFEFGKQKYKITHVDMNTYSIFKFSISHFLAIDIGNIGATLVSCKQFSVTAVPFRQQSSKRNMKYDKGMWAWPVPVINSIPAQKSY